MVPIYLVSYEYPPETDWGGIATYSYNMARGLAQLGHDVSVIALSLNGQRKEYEECGVKVKRIPFRTTHHHLWRKILHNPLFKDRFRFWHLLVTVIERSLLVYRELHRASRQKGLLFALCVDCFAEGFFLALFKSKQVKLFVNLQMASGLVLELNGYRPTWAHRIIYWMERYAIAHADLVIAPSDGMLELCQRRMQLGKRATPVIPNPIDVALFRPPSTVSKRERPMVLFTGRLEIRKGVIDFVKAIPTVLRRFPDTEFYLIGSDAGYTSQLPMRDYLTGLLNEDQRSHVTFPGSKPRDELVKFYQSCTVAVFPSHFESFGYTCLEAMACGAAVVASKAGGMASMIEDGVSGLLVDVTKEDSLALGISRLLADSEARQRLQQGAIKRVSEMFTLEKVAVAMQSTLEIHCGTASR